MQLVRLLAGFLAIGPGAAVAPAANGVPNFQQVNGRIYRGGQPSDYGFKFIAGLGVKTVIDLRRESGEVAGEEKLVSAAGMRFINIPMDDLGAPTDAQIALVLAVLADETAGPVFVHCRRGADRTGTVIACYRIAFEHWRNRQALAEAKSHGLSVFERAMQRYILDFRVPASAVPAAAVSAADR
jgi:protein tyrosine/serine phosphatase